MRDVRIVSVSYSARVTKKQLLKVLDRDDEKKTVEECLFSLIDEVDGVDRCNYNGHFGPYIYFTVEWVKRKKAVAKIHEIIEDYLKGE